MSQDSNLQDMVFVSLKRSNPVSGELNYKQGGWLGRPGSHPSSLASPGFKSALHQCVL